MVRTATRRRAGFTLIELMIVVAIIGILAAIAIPNFLQFQQRSKVSEVKLNLKAITTAQHSYFADSGRYLAAAATPAGAPGSQKRVWAGGGSAAFDTLGWSPTGEVYFTYQSDVNGAQTAFTIGAQGDLDGNGVASEFGYVHPVAGTVTTVPSGLAATCNPAGVFHPTLGFQLDTTGPCTAIDGRSRF